MDKIVIYQCPTCEQTGKPGEYHPECRDTCKHTVVNKRPKKNINKASNNRINIYKRFNGYCYYCNEKFDIHHVTTDHFIPLSKGGSNRTSNKVLACVWCNRDKKNLSVLEFYKLKGWTVPDKIKAKLQNIKLLLKKPEIKHKKVKQRNEFGETEGMIKERERKANMKRRLALLNTGLNY